MLPPNVKPDWDENGAQVQALILAFHQIRCHDEDEREAQMAGARMPST